MNVTLDVTSFSIEASVSTPRDGRDDLIERRIPHSGGHVVTIRSKSEMMNKAPGGVCVGGRTQSNSSVSEDTGTSSSEAVAGVAAIRRPRWSAPDATVGHGPQSASVAVGGGMGVAGGPGAAGRSGGGMGDGLRRSSRIVNGLHRWTCCAVTLGLHGSCGSRKRRDRRAMSNMALIANSRLWRYTTHLFSLVLLFGIYVQVLACPASWDIGFSILYIITVAVLVVDIIFNCCLDPTYFLWYCRICGSHKENTCCYRNSTADDICGAPGVKRTSCCHVGSFMFWLDLISVACMIPSIVYFNPSFYDMELVTAFVADDVMSFVDESGPRYVYVWRPTIVTLLTIGRTCRFARFISAYSAVRMAELLNCYTLSSRLAACFPKRSSPRGGGREERSHWPRRRTSERGAGGVGPYPGGGGDGENAATKGGAGGMARRATVVPGKLLHLLGGSSHRIRRDQRRDSAVRIQRWWRRCLATIVAMSPNGGVIVHQQQQQQQQYLGAQPSRFNRNVPGAAVGPGGGSGSMAAGSTATASVMRRMSKRRHRGDSSKVGSAMRELTAQRVTYILIAALLLSVLFVAREPDATNLTTMLMLHDQTRVDAYSTRAVGAARATSVPQMYFYKFANGTVANFPPPGGDDPSTLRASEMVNVTIESSDGRVTTGLFDESVRIRYDALMGLLATLFMCAIWVTGVVSTAGPVMTLVVNPIERMTRLLSMLTRDPLGYQNTPRYRKFMEEEFDIVRKTAWTEDVLKGMETSFLMSTILRIGSLMRVGFGSAGVEIIRNNLQKGSNSLVMNHKGSTVSCIFLFCDIRQFTDATEALQEEVFVFTNRIALVVHSICSSYGGSANKNVGDAFLLSWRLDDLGREGDSSNRSLYDSGGGVGGGNFTMGGMIGKLLSRSYQADRALFSVVKICIALYNDGYFLKEMSAFAREKLMEKIANRKGPAVQMGFGLHAGEAVQGAIGSQRKIDPTYVSEAVDMSETLESSTKRYGLKMLMSGAFHGLLSPSNQRRCRKIDQLLLAPEGQLADDVDMLEAGEILELFTYDMDIDALHGESSGSTRDGTSRTVESTRSASLSRSRRRASSLFPSVDKAGKSKRPSRRMSGNLAASPSGEMDHHSSPGHHERENSPSGRSAASEFDGAKKFELSLPTGPAAYNQAVWLSEEMRIIRKRYTDGLFYQTFNSGLQAYFNRDWQHAKRCFLSILDRFEDGPSRYFLNIIDENNCHPPNGFTGYGSV